VTSVDTSSNQSFAEADWREAGAGGMATTSHGGRYRNDQYAGEHRRRPDWMAAGRIDRLSPGPKMEFRDRAECGHAYGAAQGAGEHVVARHDVAFAPNRRSVGSSR
jgi:hypothetical protein